MSETFEAVKALIEAGDVRIPEHGYDELAEDHIAVREVIGGVAGAVIVEDYPEFPNGPCVLVLQFNRENDPIHAVWGVPKGHSRPAVLVTAYRPDPQRWSVDFLEGRDE